MAYTIQIYKRTGDTIVLAGTLYKKNVEELIQYLDFKFFPKKHRMHDIGQFESKLIGIGHNVKMRIIKIDG